jgi:Spy/CpxP family protein refolding chaperone
VRIYQRLAAILLASSMTLLLSLAASGVQSPRDRSATRAPAAIPQAWLARLNLTADQQLKLQAAGDAYRTDIQKAQSLTSAGERTTAARQARKTYRDAVVAALTPEQQQKLRTMRAEARDYHDLGAMANQLVILNLTDEQKGKIKGIADQYRPKLRELRASLRDASDRKAIRRQMRDLRLKMVDEVKAVLTPEQAAQLQTARVNLRTAR